MLRYATIAQQIVLPSGVYSTYCKFKMVLTLHLLVSHGTGVSSEHSGGLVYLNCPQICECVNGMWMCECYVSCALLWSGILSQLKPSIASIGSGATMTLTRKKADKSPKIQSVIRNKVFHLFFFPRHGRVFFVISCHPFTSYSIAPWWTPL